MNVRGSRKIVVLGMMTRHPVAGVVWQTLHYVEGLRRLGYDPYYVEAGAYYPSSMLEERPEVAPATTGAGSTDPGPGTAADPRPATATATHTDRAPLAAAFLDRIFRRFDLADRWAFHALHSDERCYGLEKSELMRVYGEAELILNLHGATLPRPEHVETGRLVYLETDPVWIQIELHEGLRRTRDFLAPHRAFFTFGENYGTPVCSLPVAEEFPFRPTRQPVVMDFWPGPDTAPAGGACFTTIGNWKQTWRDVRFNGETYRWSKHHEFEKFLDLPRRTGHGFELALSPRGCGPEERDRLRASGWRVRDALPLSTDLDRYRDYIRGSRGEFTVAKDQNVRFRTGWFSDRSATYLAVGRPVVTQDTGFGEVVPTGRGLFAFRTMEEIEDALDRIVSEEEEHARAAREIAREYFAHDVVLPPLLEEAGI